MIKMSDNLTPQPQSISSSQETAEQASDLQIREITHNLEKFKQVLLYVLDKVGEKKNVGETVLHKLLYFIDFDYYEKYEENLMGSTYIKNHHGPTCNELKSTVEKMQIQGQIKVFRTTYGHPQTRYQVLESPNFEFQLSERERKHIDGVLERLSDMNATEIGEYSHGDIPWKSARDGEKLSYESVFYRDDQYSVRDYEDEL